MSTIVKITSENLDEVLSSSIDSTIIVKCFAPWCGPCKALSPLFKRISTEFESNSIIFHEVDIDECERFVSAFGIQTVPTILALKNKACVGRVTGAVSYDKLKEFVITPC